MRKMRFKQFLRERNQFSKTGDETLLSVSEYYGVKPRAEAFASEEHKGRAATLEGYRMVKNDDLVMNYMLAWKGAYGVSNHDGIVSPAYSVFKVDQTVVDVRYLHHRVRSDDMKAYFRSRSKGIIESRLRLYPDSLLASFVEIPDLATQRQIANFLDRETARIDLLIEKKQRLVALLAEQRASVIASAVTVGLDKRSELVKTNSQYLPRIPASWRVWRLKHLADIRGGLTLGRQIPEDVETTMVPYMRVANVQAGWLNLSDVAEIPVTKAEKKRYLLEHGDVLMNEGGDNDKLGRGAVWKSELDTCVHQNHVFSVRPHDTRYSEWLSLATNARFARDFFFLHSNQSTNLASISKTNLARFPVAIPPLDEMRATLEILWSRVGKLDQIGDKTNASIDRLKEYRAALITAAVTGQIDVETYAKSGTPDRRLDAIQEEMGA